MTKLSIRWLRPVTLMILSFSPAFAAVYSAYAVKAAFLYRFASYVQWPDDAGAERFVIAVVGAEDVARHLDALLPQIKVDGRPAEVRRVTRTAELEGVRILYVGPAPLAQSRALRAAAAKRPILIVTDDERGLDGGGVINFVESEHNVRFEISLLAADRARLRIDSALLAVAARVERRPQAWNSCAQEAMPALRAAGCVIRMAALDTQVGR